MCKYGDGVYVGQFIEVNLQYPVYRALSVGRMTLQMMMWRIDMIHIRDM